MHTITNAIKLILVTKSHTKSYTKWEMWDLEFILRY